MRIFTNLSVAALMGICGLSAGAQELGNAAYITPIPGNPQTSLKAITLGWSLDDVSLELIKVADPDLAVLVTFGGRTYELEYGDYDIYMDPDLNYMGNYDNVNLGNVLIISWGMQAFDAGYPLGDYTVDIPEGLVSNASGQTNAEQTLTFRKADAAAPLSIVPESETLCDHIDNVTITFNEEVALNPYGGRIELSPLDWFGTNPYYIEKDRCSIGADGKSLVLNVSGLLSRGEWYSVLIPEGFVTVGSDYVNERLWLEYMFWDGLPQARIVSAPEWESAAGNVKPFVLTWDNQTVHIPDNAPETEFVIGFPDAGFRDGERLWIPADWYETVHVDADGNYFPASEALPANGVFLDVEEFTEDWVDYQFTIIFPAGLVCNAEGVDSPPLSYTFFVKNLWYEYKVTTGADAVINVAFPGADWATYGLGDVEVTLCNVETGVETPLLYNYGGWTDGAVGLENEAFHGLTVNLSNLDMADGNYILRIPQGYVYVKGLLNGTYYEESLMNIVINYEFGWNGGEFTGFNSISLPQADTDSPVIYDLQGRRVSAGSDLSGLAPGIYIVNGRKVLK